LMISSLSTRMYYGFAQASKILSPSTGGAGGRKWPSEMRRIELAEDITEWGAVMKNSIS